MTPSTICRLAGPLLLAACATDSTRPKAPAPAEALIAFSVRVPSPDSMPIYIVRPDGTGLKRIVHGPGTRYGVAWAPDRLRLVYVYSATGIVDQAELRVVNVDGSNDHRIIGPGAYWAPAWSPDGSRILFSLQDSAGMYQLTTVSPVVSGLSPLAAREADDWAAAWSPDGTRIAVVSNCRGAPPCNRFVSDLWVLNADGSDPHQLTFGTEIDDDAAAPTWSPDGHWIAFQMTRRFPSTTFATNLYRIHPSGDSLQQLTFGDFTVQNLGPSFAPDGSALLFTTWSGPDPFTTPIFVANPDATSPRPLGLAVGEPVGATWAR